MQPCNYDKPCQCNSVPKLLLALTVRPHHLAPKCIDQEPPEQLHKRYGILPGIK